MHNPLSRRTFVKTIAAGLIVSGRTRGAAVSETPLRLGFDNFSVRACGWKAEELLAYASSLKVDAVFFTDLNVYRSHEIGYLRELRQEARHLGIEVQVGTGGVCPTSKTFDSRFGSADEHLALAIKVARAMESPVVRCYLGNMDDRRGPGGIERHMRSLVGVLRAVRNQALEGGLKIAVENHAGDMQARQLARLIEEAGPEFVGATMDSGNATWALEDPLENLETLGPYAAATGIRDSMVWKTPKGAGVQWTAVGEGLVDFERYFRRFRVLCPGVIVQLEIISGFNREFPFLDTDFWQGYEDVPGPTLAGFLRLAERGRPLEPARFPEGEARKEAESAYQRDQLERSLRYCRERLGLGVKRG